MITPAYNITATERVLPKLALDFTTGALDGRVTFTRTTGASNPATYFNSSGYLVEATNNQPRFDYSPATLACKGLLIEESRSNLVIYSSDMTNPAWGNTGITRAGGQADLSNGTSAIVVTETTATSNHYLQSGTIAMTSGTTYTSSVFVKAGSATVVQLTFPSAVNSTSAYANFNLATGEVGATSGATATISAVRDGWYRCTFAMAATATASGRFFLFFTNNDPNAARAPSYTGTSQTVFACYPQIELGAFATSYIPTTLLPLTRNADVATMTGTNFSDWFNASEGTFVAQCSTMSIAASKYVFSLAESSGTDNQQVLLANYTNAGRVRYLGYEGTTNTISLYPSAVHAANEKLTIAVATKTDNSSLAVNGVAAATDLSGVIPTSLTQMKIGRNTADTLFLDGHLAYLNYYPQRLTTPEVQAFSKD